MKQHHTAVIVVVVGAALLYYMYKFTGASTNCSFFDSILGKCGSAA